MIAIVLAGIVLGATALILAKGRRGPEPRRVRVEKDDDRRRPPRR